MLNVSSTTDQERPMLPIRIHQFHGSACLDTGSKTSIAGAQLYKLLISCGEPFIDKDVTIKLADGNERRVIAKQFNIVIHLQSKEIQTSMLAIPEFVNSRTLLGADFIKAAGMILDFAQNNWFFSNNPETRYGFLTEEIANSVPIDAIQGSDLSLRAHEGETLHNNEHDRINPLLNEFADTLSRPPRHSDSICTAAVDLPVTDGSKIRSLQLEDADLRKIIEALESTDDPEQDHAKSYADTKRIPGPNYKVGDKVLVATHALSNAKQGYTAKFAPRRDGPYVIMKKVSPSAFQISSLQSPDVPLGTYHTSSLTPFTNNSVNSDPAPVRPIRKKGRPKRM
ncbi:hypothetical protein PPYR_00678 [Photinus pyralis]|uniref:Retropepsins domain-containing protein n=1 Tax=Photinus pyralis TaxID=7054 RepID=A0A5N4B2F6_PHOPY|nr:hypothetical protein PPYR_00678 [Photinus pyralis]